MDLKFKPISLIKRYEKKKYSGKFTFEVETTIEDYKILEIEKSMIQKNIYFIKKPYLVSNRNPYEFLFKFDTDNTNRLGLFNPWEHTNHSMYNTKLFPFLKEITGLEYTYNQNRVDNYGDIKISYNNQVFEFGQKGLLWLDIDDSIKSPLKSNRFTFKGKSNE